MRIDTWFLKVKFICSVFTTLKTAKDLIKTFAVLTHVNQLP